jgi:prepilin-type N-terminal cleavage/methylation domain-containing protein
MTAPGTPAQITTKRFRQGFTLIELLIVVVVIGLLTAIAIPKFSNTKGKAVVAAMRSDLHNLAAAEESYWAENQTYYNGPVPAAALSYQPTAGVTVTIVSGTVSGWSAQATSPQTPQTCVVFYGAAPPIPPATADGAVACS